MIYNCDEFGNVIYDLLVNARAPSAVDTPDYIEGYTPIDNPYRYAGYEYIEEVGLYDLNARYYNPEIARFLSQDPYYNLGNRIIGLYEINVPTAASIMQANNLFAYCGNNPVRHIDTSGNGFILAALATIAVSSLVSGVIGGVANASKGKSFWNGFAGGAANGAIQSSAVIISGPVGAIWGGAVGGAAGSAMTNSLNGVEDYTAIVEEAISSAVGGAVTGTISASVMGLIKEADKIGSIAQELMKYDKNFGKYIIDFFNSADDALSYNISDIVNEYYKEKT